MVTYLALFALLASNVNTKTSIQNANNRISSFWDGIGATPNSDSGCYGQALPIGYTVVSKFNYNSKMSLDNMLEKVNYDYMSSNGLIPIKKFKTLNGFKVNRYKMIGFPQYNYLLSLRNMQGMTKACSIIYK